MQKMGVLVLGLGLLLSACGTSSQTSGPSSTDQTPALERTADVIPGEAIVLLAEGESFSGLSSELSSLGLSAVRELSGGELLVQLGGNLSAQSTLSAQATLDAIGALERSEKVKYVQPNYRLTAQRTANDPLLARQWALPKMNLPQAWDLSTGVSSTVVAVLDTGITAHPDLAGRSVAGYDFISNSTTAVDGGGRDSDPNDPGDRNAAGECGSGSAASGSSFHGSHVAGSIGAASDNALGITGVNWNAKLQSLRVLGKCGGSTADIVDAIRWAGGIAVAGVPANATPAKVLNMSLGGFSGSPCASSDLATQRAINDVLARGVSVVVAAGNSNDDASKYTPASCDGVITVAASETRDYRAPYSNFGTYVEVAAPGGDSSANRNGDADADGILSTLKTDAGSYIYGLYQGTSMATPHVAGVVSLMLGLKPTLTPAEVSTLLRNTARAIPAGGCTQGCGSGVVDAFAALQAVQSGTTPPPPPPPTPSDDSATGAVLLTRAASKSGSVSSSDVQDWYKFTATGGSATVRMTTGSDADLYVYSSNATTLVGKSELGSSNAETVTRTLNAGTYYVKVLRYSGTPSYTVTLSGAAQ